MVPRVKASLPGNTRSLFRKIAVTSMGMDVFLPNQSDVNPVTGYQMSWLSGGLSDEEVCVLNKQDTAKRSGYVTDSMSLQHSTRPGEGNPVLHLMFAAITAVRKSGSLRGHYSWLYPKCPLIPEHKQVAG